MRAAPGFAGVRWDAAETVEVTTLDALIAAHGLPRFVKIDVEGFEAEVLAGLGQPVALGRLRVPAGGARGRRRLPRRGSPASAPTPSTSSPGEAAAFALDRWLDADAIARGARRRAARRPRRRRLRPPGGRADA